jgi:hypothetical protein
LKAARVKADLKEHVRRFRPEVREHRKQWVLANKHDGRRNLGIEAANTASVCPLIFAALAGVLLAPPEKKAKAEGGPSEPQPGAAAAIDRLDEVDMGDGMFK